MVTKRERSRAGISEDGKSDPALRGGGGESSGSRAERDRKLIISTRLLLIVVVPAISVLAYFILYFSSTTTSQDLPYVRRRGLVDTDIDYRQILNEHMKTSDNSTGRNFKNPVLAYITPWNSQGYDMAKKFINKFTHLSPVWYELKSQGAEFVLEGRHNADMTWMTEIRRAGSTQILPRVVWEAVPLGLLKKKRQRDKVINLIVAECIEMEYDGIVLESWSRWSAFGVLHDPDLRIKAVDFIRQLGHAMHSINVEGSRSQNLQLIFVIGPPRSAQATEIDFRAEDLLGLREYVDGFSLMTYDFSGPQNPGPNAPLKWIQSTLMILLDGSNTADHHKLAQKIFIGLNFYGNDFVASGGLGGGPIIGREYLSLLEQHQPPVYWEKNSGEHFFLYLDNHNVKHVVFYPSLMSIDMRIQEARSCKAGIAIWEIGQGLEPQLYFRPTDFTGKVDSNMNEKDDESKIVLQAAGGDRVKMEVELTIGNCGKTVSAVQV